MPSNTIGILNSALQVNKKKMDIAMQNIANSDNKIYSAKEVDISSISSGEHPQGVKIDKIKNKTDALMEKNLLSANATSESSKYVSDISKEIVDKLARPGSDASLYNRLSEFEDAIRNASLNPMDISLRNDLRSKVDKLADYIKGTATFIQEKRFEADKKIGAALTEVNGILSSMNSANAKRMLHRESSMEYCQMSDQIDSELAKLSKYFGIRSDIDSEGVLHVHIKNNGQEILGKQMYHFEYNPQRTIDDFINDQPLNPLYLVSKSFSGSQENRAVIIDGYKSSNLTYDFGAGLINGLLQVRDDLTTRVSETLDQLALNVAEAFNEVHNNGSGLTPSSSLTGTTLVSQSDQLIGSGNVIINAMDSYGKPIVSGDSGKIPALNLNLTQFTNNGMPGTFNVAGVVSEINNYFAAAATGSRLAINGFHTINMAVTSADLGTGNNMKLDFDLIGYTTQSGVSNMGFSISNVSAVDSTGTAVATTHTSPAGFNINNGAHERSSINGGPTINLSNTGSYPITVSLDITTTVNGVNTTTTVKYTVNAPTSSELTSVNSIVNKRFTPTTLVSSSDPNVKLLGAGFLNPIIKASIVDEIAREVTGSSPGFLKIESLARGYGIAIDESNSQVRSSTNQKISGGFSNAFSMNDVFVFKKDGATVSDLRHTKNIASFIQLNDSIKVSPSGFSLGRIEQYRAGESSFDAPGIFYALGSGDTSLVKGYNNIRGKNMIFSQTRDIDVKQTNIYDYAMDIVNVNNIRSVNLNVDAVRNDQIREMIANDLSGVRGVNIDDEAIKIIQYQKNYSIAAKFINTTNHLLQTLIDNIN